MRTMIYCFNYSIKGNIKFPNITEIFLLNIPFKNLLEKYIQISYLPHRHAHLSLSIIFYMSSPSHLLDDRNILRFSLHQIFHFDDFTFLTLILSLFSLC